MKTINITGLFLLLLFRLWDCNAQVKFEPNVSYINKFNFKPVHTIQQKISSASISIENYYVEIFAVSATMAMLAGKNDNAWDEEYALEKHKFPFWMIQSFGKIGNLYDYKESYFALAGLSMTAVGYGLLYDKPKPVQTVKLMFKSWLTTSIITSVVKISVGRHRPFLNEGANQFDLFKFNLNSSRMSFPSGHSSSIFSIMTVLAQQYDHPLVKISAYGFATSVAFQRMLYRKHWASDVIAGGLIGYWIGSSVVKNHKFKIYKFKLYPYSESNKLGIALNF